MSKFEQDLRYKSKIWHSKNYKCVSFFTANAIHTEEQFKYTVAYNQKIPLSIIQHGNGYGTDKIISAEDYETHLADKFYTWGWGENILTHQKLNFNKNITVSILEQIPAGLNPDDFLKKLENELYRELANIR